MIMEMLKLNKYNLKARQRKLKWILRLGRLLQKKILKKHFSRKKARQLLKMVKQEEKEVVQKIPYIGGKENTFSKFLVFSSAVMPNAKVLEKEKISTREAGQILFEITERTYSLQPKFLLRKEAKETFKPETIQNWRETCKKSKKKEFKMDWVCDFVEGTDDDSFVYGLTMKECGILKFWKQEGLEKYVPYLCLTDWASWKRTGIIVERTKTLANGAECCDYRYIRIDDDGPTGWPPESMPEWTGKYEKS
jgi:hypothetical protein